jgi:hypothetical protein
MLGITEAHKTCLEGKGLVSFKEMVVEDWTHWKDHNEIELGKERLSNDLHI